MRKLSASIRGDADKLSEELRKLQIRWYSARQRQLQRQLIEAEGLLQQGQQALAAVREILRRAYRASSLVECINSVLRMQQAQHRKMTQGLLDLKRLYWNCHTFRTGRRRGTTPYQRLGVPWPEGLRWWALAVTVFAGVSMVSNFKYYSFKTINLRRSVPFVMTM